MSGYTFMEKNSVIFIFASGVNRGQHFKERICSPRSKLFFLRVDPIFEKLSHINRQTESHKNSFL